MVTNCCGERNKYPSQGGLQETHARALPSRGESSERPDDSLSLLLVEDHALTRKSLERGFRQHGFVVCSSANGREAVMIYALNARELDIVLCDLNMPGMDGLAVCQAAREINPHVRFCFMTGDTRSGTKEALLGAGALRVFTKPLSPLSDISQELRLIARRPSMPEAIAIPSVEQQSQHTTSQIDRSKAIASADLTVRQPATLRQSMGMAQRRPR